MRKKLFIVLSVLFIAIFISGCSQDDVVGRQVDNIADSINVDTHCGQDNVDCIFNSGDVFCDDNGENCIGYADLEGTSCEFIQGDPGMIASEVCEEVQKECVFEVKRQIAKYYESTDGTCSGRVQLWVTTDRLGNCNQAMSHYCGSQSDGNNYAEPYLGDGSINISSYNIPWALCC